MKESERGREREIERGRERERRTPARVLAGLSYILTRKVKHLI